MKKLGLIALAALIGAAVGCSKGADAATTDKSPDAAKPVEAPTAKVTGGMPKPTASGLDPTK